MQNLQNETPIVNLQDNSRENEIGIEAVNTKVQVRQTVASLEAKICLRDQQINGLITELAACKYDKQNIEQQNILIDELQKQTRLLERQQKQPTLEAAKPLKYCHANEVLEKEKCQTGNKVAELVQHTDAINKKDRELTNSDSARIELLPSEPSISLQEKLQAAEIQRRRPNSTESEAEIMEAIFLDSRSANIYRRTLVENKTLRLFIKEIGRLLEVKQEDADSDNEALLCFMEVIKVSLKHCLNACSSKAFEVQSESKRPASTRNFISQGTEGFQQQSSLLNENKVLKVQIQKLREKIHSTTEKFSQHKIDLVLQQMNDMKMAVEDERGAFYRLLEQKDAQIANLKHQLEKLKEFDTTAPPSKII